MEIDTHPAECFHLPVRCVDSEGLHLSLSVAHKGSGTDPNASPQILHPPNSLVDFLLPTSNSVHETTMEHENSTFVWIAASKSNLSLTKVSRTVSIHFLFVAPATAPIWACCGQTLPISNCMFFSFHSSALLYTWPPITGTGSRCQHINYGHDLKKAGLAHIHGRRLFISCLFRL